MKNKDLDIIESIVARCKPEIEVDYDPSGSWESIDRRLDRIAVASERPSKKIIPLWLRLSSVAAVLMLGIMVGRYSLPTINNVSSSPIAEIQTHYKQEVNRQITLVKAYDPQHAIIDEIKLLDQQITVLEEDYRNANELQREHILESMIANYQARVDLLQNIISKLNTHSHDKITEI